MLVARNGRFLAIPGIAISSPNAIEMTNANNDINSVSRVPAIRNFKLTLPCSVRGDTTYHFKLELLQPLTKPILKRSNKHNLCFIKGSVNSRKRLVVDTNLLLIAVIVQLRKGSLIPKINVAKFAAKTGGNDQFSAMQRTALVPPFRLFFLHP